MPPLTRVLRNVLNEIYKEDADFRSFVQDYFPRVHLQIGGAMSRTQILNLLFTHETAEKVKKQLNRARAYQAKSEPVCAELEAMPRESTRVDGGRSPIPAALPPVVETFCLAEPPVVPPLQPQGGSAARSCVMDLRLLLRTEYDLYEQIERRWELDGGRVLAFVQENLPGLIPREIKGHLRRVCILRDEQDFVLKTYPTLDKEKGPIRIAKGMLGSTRRSHAFWPLDRGGGGQELAPYRISLEYRKEELFLILANQADPPAELLVRLVLPAGKGA